MAMTGNMFALLDDEDGPKPAARAPAKAAPAAEKKSAKMPEKSCAYSPDVLNRDRSIPSEEPSPERRRPPRWCLPETAFHNHRG